MPILGVSQPQIIHISETLRLRAYDGNFMTGLPWYQNEVVYSNSEGITDKARIPDEKWVEAMYTHFQNSGESEMYFIEVQKDGVFIPIGDVALQERNPPIVIGVDEYRGLGIGRQVMTAIINRAREIGLKRIYDSEVYDYNVASQRLHESLGFRCVRQEGKTLYYELPLE